MKKLITALVLFATPALAQQSVQDTARLIIEQQRNQAMNAVADLAKANQDLQNELNKLKAEIEELKKGNAKQKP